MAEKEYIDKKPIVRDLIAMKREYDAITLTGIIKALQDAPAADVVELPLNIGDVVYASRRWEENGAFLPYQITCLTITQNKKKEWRRNYRAFRLINGKTIDSYVSFSFDEIGKEVFLTIEEAERYAKMNGEMKEATP